MAYTEVITRLLLYLMQLISVLSDVHQCVKYLDRASKMAALLAQLRSCIDGCRAHKPPLQEIAAPDRLPANDYTDAFMNALHWK